MKTLLLILSFWSIQNAATQPTGYINLENSIADVSYPDGSADNLYPLFDQLRSTVMHRDSLSGLRFRNKKKIMKEENAKVVKIQQQYVQAYHMAEKAKLDFILEKIENFRSSRKLGEISVEEDFVCEDDCIDYTLDFLDFLHR
ncbi:hypothetical protein JYT74_02365 [Crocinitomix catalasitica]|nr:hypothetical protein [Crocinitomix catalasitica]